MKTRVYDDKSLKYLPVYPLTLGFNNVQEDIIREQGMKFHQIFLVEGGTGIITVDEVSTELERGDMFFIRSNVPHSYIGYSEDFATNFLGFDGNICGDIFNYYKAGSSGVYKGKNYNIVRQDFKQLYANFDAILENSALSAKTYSLIICFFDEAFKKKHTLIESVYNYLEVNYQSPITLDEILEFYPYSKSKLCSDFKQEYGMTIFDMLTKIRLRHAQNMIRNDNKIKIKNVAKYCGFNDVSYFCKLYKREFNKSPNANRD